MVFSNCCCFLCPLPAVCRSTAICAFCVQSCVKDFIRGMCATPGKHNTLLKEMKGSWVLISLRLSKILQMELILTFFKNKILKLKKKK